MSKRQNQCKCGKMKDYRSIKCIVCRDLQPIEKVCNGCNRLLSIENFSVRGKTKRRTRCKECEASEMRQWRKENPDEFRRRKRQWEKDNPEKYQRGVRRRGWRKLGLNPNIIEPIFNNHNHKCDCCGYETKTLVTDHCHLNGYFRGFLCSNCNTGLGQFKDDTIRLQKAIDYLTKHASFGNPDQSREKC